MCLLLRGGFLAIIRFWEEWLREAENYVPGLRHRPLRASCGAVVERRVGNGYG